jgi:hypothetical protein
LRRGGVVEIAGGVGGTALGEDPALHLVDLPLEPFDTLLGRGRLPLGHGRRRRHEDHCGGGGEHADRTHQFHEIIPTLRFGRDCDPRRLDRG